MKSFNNDIGAYAFLGLLVATVWAIPLAVFLHRDAHGSPMELPRCLEARTLDQVRAALEAQGNRTVLGLYAATEVRSGANRDYRRCMATVVTDDGEAHIGFTIGWHDRRNGIPFWAGDGLPSSRQSVSKH
ncbi:hypothetical protein [Polymorphum gilvum]|uniref:Uncharacterized protein n=1 Tax=Polymorphum gilvum (strain LMG 25793 / CGMCC 1.9160 / SL003B-26A1) TaxID=991905 RepID=F2J3W3_POLGS|nr:hypothetical protein [Polymorphum gilvum]ADZ68945.1 hypothetical protein SL003B_0512 [Polymorphum gilvum SL003B-26A1]